MPAIATSWNKIRKSVNQKRQQLLIKAEKEAKKSKRNNKEIKRLKHLLHVHCWSTAYILDLQTAYIPIVEIISFFTVCWMANNNSLVICVHCISTWMFKEYIKVCIKNKMK